MWTWQSKNPHGFSTAENSWSWLHWKLIFFVEMKRFFQIFVHLAFYIWLTTSDCFKSCWTSHDLQCVLQHSKTKDVFKCSSQFSNENIFSYINTLPTCVILCLSPRILIIQLVRYWANVSSIPQKVAREGRKWLTGQLLAPPLMPLAVSIDETTREQITGGGDSPRS